jgi:hydroxyquinol 1,2-dioxygenase
VDVWRASGEGHCENQDPAQADMNLRGKFRTDAKGCIEFRTVKPSGYPIPVDGPVGQLVDAKGRHDLRPAHIPFMVHKAGYKTEFSQLYSADHPNLETDVQFGVTAALIGHYEAHDQASEPAPDAALKGRWYSLQHQSW